MKTHTGFSNLRRLWNGLRLSASPWLALGLGATLSPAATVPPVIPIKAQPFALTEVRLLDGPFKHAMELDRAYLLSLDVDRLLHTFRINAGLPSSAEPLGGWEEPKCELRGHFAGHYLSGCALMYASTGDERLKQKGEALVAGLAECQNKIGTGYLSAFPEEFFDRVEAQKRVWAPYYTLHKIFAGLLDMYTYCSDRQALDVAKRFGDWVIARNSRLSDEQMQGMLRNEHGGMNEALANLYALTGEDKYLRIGERFNHMAVLGPASEQQDKLTGLHANTQFPKFIGAAREYELTGQAWLKTATLFFWNTVVNERSYVIGGNSDGEMFTSKATLSHALGPNTTETCNTYNMLKLTRHLYEWDPQPRYADYYERALYNHILASQNPETGMMCYYVPLRTGSQKVYNGPLDAFWCCTGTGVENHAKYGDSIYFHDAERTLYVNLFIASELNWKAKGLQLRQETRFPDESQTKLIFTCDKPTELTVNLRRPAWATESFEVRLNGRRQWIVSRPGDYAVLNRTWNNGDTLDVAMPFTLHTEGFQDNPHRFAVLNGPLVLGAKVDTNQPVPLVVGEPAQLLAQLKPVEGKPSTFTVNSDVVRAPGRPGAAPLTFEPFYAIHGKQSYEVYFDAVTPEEFRVRGAAKPAEAPPSKEAKLTVRVDQPGPKASPRLWGIFFEDINLSADGGIYPELVRNRSFEDSDKLEHWAVEAPTGVRAGEVSIDTKTPLNPMNRRSLRVQFNGPISLVNHGYWGMNLVEHDPYQLTFYARADDGFKGPIRASLESASGQTAAQGEISGLTDHWQRFTLDLTPAISDPKGQLKLSASGHGTFWVDMVSLLPRKTWKEHGLRPDLSQMLADLRPAFMRFPGGCWVEGGDMAHMYHWKETIGDIAHRQPLWNIWAYNATHGLGYHEYLQMAEDLGAAPLFCINVGMSHHENAPLDQMSQWVQDALDAIEYANGPTNTVWGAERARNGHPAPFHLKYLEIGNENGGPAYQDRYALFYDALKARHPEIQLVANVPTEERPAEIVDEHYYNNPEFFIGQAHRYDTYPRDGSKIFVGEYAVTSGCGQGNLRAAVGEAAFMTGLERNSDVVLMASYAPLFVNVNHKRWNPDLINFDSARAYGIPSYYVQQMFSQNRGDIILPVEVQSPTTSEAHPGGAIGVGTWLTQAEFKDIKVTRNGETLFSADLANSTEGWHLHGGDWKTENGVLRQTSGDDNVRAIIGDKGWTDYTYSLNARKLGGAEGFLILFNVQDEEAKSWWNIGGWGNERHALEMGGVVGKEVPGHIETGRWYDIRVEVTGKSIKCYLDGKLIHDVPYPSMQSLYASATRVANNGNVILKVVNVAPNALTTKIDLTGIGQVRSPAKTIVLTSAKPTDENSLNEPRKVAPVAQDIEMPGPSFERTFPGNSVTVLRFEAPY